MMTARQVGQVLHYHLRFYQLLGMHDLPLSEGGHRLRKVKEKILHCWAVCLASGFTVLVLICMTSDDEYLYQGDRFSYFNDGLKYSFAELAVLTIYIETLQQRKHLARFWQLYGTVAPSPAGTVRGQLVQHFRYLLVFYGINSLEIAILVIVRCVNTMWNQLVLFWCTFQPFVFVVHWRNSQFQLHLELMRQQLVQLERELTLLADYSAFASDGASFKGFEDYLRRRVRQKQLIYMRIYELYNCFNQSFGYSVLTVLLMIYVRVVVDCYFMYYTIYNNVENIDYYLLLPAMLHIPTFIYFSQSCMQMMSRIAYQLHCIVATSPALSLQVSSRNSYQSTANLSQQIQNFSLQILHQPVRIDCLGLTVLNAYLMTRIATAVSTYMIFTVQLMPKLSVPYK